MMRSIFIAFLFIRATTMAQLVPVEQRELFDRSSLIVEGIIIDKSNFRYPSNNKNYTAYTIKICKVFKGVANFYNVEMITSSGMSQPGLKDQTEVSVNINDRGVFFLQSNAAQMISPHSGRRLFDLVEGRQGLIKYNLSTNTASSAFMHFTGINSGLYPYLVRMTNRHWVSISKTCSITKIKRPKTKKSP